MGGRSRKHRVETRELRLARLERAAEEELAKQKRRGILILFPENFRRRRAPK